MGLDAEVACNCWALGQTTAPPISRNLLDPEIPRLADGLDLPHAEWRRLDSLLWEWRKSCCEHPRMNVVQIRIGSWASVRSFNGAVERIDTGQLPTLRGLLPDFNGGSVRWQEAAKALAELDLFQAGLTNYRGPFLVDLETREELFGAPFTPRSWVRYGVEASGFDARGIWVLKDGDTEVFRAGQVHQRDLGGGAVEFVGTNGQRYVGKVGFADGDHDWGVRIRTISPTDLPCLKPVRLLLEDSVRVRGEITWW